LDAALFELNGTTLAALGGIMGVLAGAITYLMKHLLASKDQQIDDLAADRDYWRGFAMSMLGPAEKAASIAERASTSAVEVDLVARLAALEAQSQSRPPRRRPAVE
jgi:hypothetical protein